MWGGTLDFEINSGTVTVGGDEGVYVDAGAVLIAGGSVDPFINSTTGGYEYSNTMGNDSRVGCGGFRVTEGVKSVVSVDGTGDLFIGNGATLYYANHVFQHCIRICGTGQLIADDEDLPADAPAADLRKSFVSTAQSVSIDVQHGARFDVGNKALIIDYGAGNGSDPIATIRSYLASAYDNGAWDGPGIGTTVLAPGAGLGYAESANATASAAGGNWLGFQPVDGKSILIVYTWYGDLNLDGKVDSTDLAKMGVIPTTAVNAGLIGWFDGDLNYDGVVNADDFALFYMGELDQTGSLPAFSNGGANGQFASSLMAFPEPSVSILPLLLLGFRKRSRRIRRA